MANPRTVANIKKKVDEHCVEHFLYIFLSFGASIRGFQKLRHDLMVDGTHLSVKYKGVLLTASDDDAHFLIFCWLLQSWITKMKMHGLREEGWDVFS